MAESIKVGSAEFELLMNLPAFKQAVERDAPQIAASGAQKVAAELEKGAKAGSDAQIREAKRASAAIEQQYSVNTAALIRARQQQASVDVTRLGGGAGAGAGGGPGQGDTRARAQSALLERQAQATTQAVNRQNQAFGNGAAVLAYTAAIVLAGRAFNSFLTDVSKTVELQNELNKTYGEGTVALTSYTALQTNLDKLGKSTGELGAALGQSLAVPLAAVVDLLTKGSKAAADFVKSTLPLSEQRQVDQLNALNEANSEQHKKERQNAADDAKAVAESAQEKSRAEIESLDKQKTANQENADNQKRRIADVRDAKLKALDDEQRGVERAFADEERASQKSFQRAIAAAEQQRDARVKAVEDAKDNALRVIDLEERARSDARRREDIDVDRSETQQRRALDAKHEASLRALDTEKTAVEAKRDAAIRAIDAESEQEDVRHTIAMRNIDQEEAAKTGAIDAELRKLDQAQQKEQRASNDRNLKEGLSDARVSLADARKGGNPRAIASALRAVRNAEEAIAKERRDREREDLRQSLQDQRENIRAQATEAKRAEQERTTVAKDEFGGRKQILADETQAALDQIDIRKKQQADANAAELQQFTDHLKDLATARQDARTEEDKLTELHKQQVALNAKAEVDSIKAAYDDPVNGIIASLKKQEEDVQASFEKRKRTIEDHYRDQKLAINDIADYAARSLDNQTRTLFNYLETQKSYWTEYARHAQQMAAAAAGQVNKPQLPAGQQQSHAQQQGYGSNYGQQVSYPQSAPASIPTQQPEKPKDGQGLLDWLHQLGGGTGPWTPHARGTIVREPTYMVGKYTGKRGMMAENGAERIVPEGGGRTSTVINITNNIDGAKISNEEALAKRIVNDTVDRLAYELDRTQRSAGPSVPDTLPGAM